LAGYFHLYVFVFSHGSIISGICLFDLHIFSGIEIGCNTRPWCNVGKAHVRLKKIRSLPTNKTYMLGQSIKENKINNFNKLLAIHLSVGKSKMQLVCAVRKQNAMHLSERNHILLQGDGIAD
jgi:hypothetical protein